MKNRKGLHIAVLCVVLVTYSFIAVTFSPVKNDVFWTALGIVDFALILDGIIAYCCIGNHSNTLLHSIPVVTLSSLYILVTFVLNIIFGIIVHIGMRTLLSIQITAFTLFVALAFSLYFCKTSDKKQIENKGDEMSEFENLIFSFESVKFKLSVLPQIIANSAIQSLNSILVELRFSDYSETVDVTEFDNQLRAKAILLSTAVDQLVDTNSTDLSGFKSLVKESIVLIEERNNKIKLSKSEVNGTLA